MAGRRPLPDIMGEALGRLPALAPVEPEGKVVAIGRPAEAELGRLAAGMRRLGLVGMARALDEMAAGPAEMPRAFADRLERLLAAEAGNQGRRRLAARLKRAGLRYQAEPDQVESGPDRGLTPARLRELTAGRWVARGQDLLLSGPTGVGKTFVACALASAACRAGHTALYRPLPALLAELAAARRQGTLARRLAVLARPALLVLDDWGLEPLERAERLELLQLIDRRHGRRSTLVAGQLPPESWDRFLGDGATASAIRDRLLSGSQRLALSGPSRRT